MKIETANRIIISDATTGSHIKTIEMEDWQKTTIATMVNDLFIKDLLYKQHGIHITYAIS